MRCIFTVRYFVLDIYLVKGISTYSEFCFAGLRSFQGNVYCLEIVRELGRLEIKYILDKRAILQ